MHKNVYPPMEIEYIKQSFKIIFKAFIYLFLGKEEGRENERERSMDVREKHQLVVSYMHPDQGLNPQPRHVL